MMMRMSNKGWKGILAFLLIAATGVSLLLPLGVMGVYAQNGGEEPPAPQESTKTLQEELALTATPTPEETPTDQPTGPPAEQPTDTPESPADPGDEILPEPTKEREIQPKDETRDSPPVPAKPTLLSPANKHLTNNNTPTLSWNAVDYGETYHVQIAMDAKFKSITQEEDNIAALSFTTSLLADGRYYWRARAKNTNGVFGPWSAARSFMVDTIPPAAPALSSPAGGSSVVGTPTFKWRASTGANYYQFAYSLSDDPDASEHASDWLTALSYKPPVEMPLGNHYWFARAKDAAGNIGDWSAGWQVTVLPPIPAQVTLTSPSSGYTTQDPSIFLDWDPVDYAHQYEIQLDDHSTFSSPNFTYTSAVETNSYTITDLIPGIWFWRVRALNTNSQHGPWSESRFFQYSILNAQLTIRLTWGNFLANLESHLWLPSATPFHVFPSNKGDLASFPFAQLDGDDISYLGPEVITITEFQEGVYQYNVYNSGYDPLTFSHMLNNSGAKVEVFSNGSLINTFNVSDAGGTSTGLWWKVFTYDSNSNTFTWVNTLSNTPDSDY